MNPMIPPTAMALLDVVSFENRCHYIVCDVLPPINIPIVTTTAVSFRSAGLPAGIAYACRPMTDPASGQKGVWEACWCRIWLVAGFKRREAMRT